jgi:hypothetical protein
MRLALLALMRCAVKHLGRGRAEPAAARPWTNRLDDVLGQGHAHLRGRGRLRAIPITRAGGSGWRVKGRTSWAP